MAVTVEELQIVLHCDATQAEAALKSLNSSVDKAVEKMENSGKGGKALNFYEKVSKKLQAAMQEASKAFDEFEASGDAGAKANFGHYIEQAKKLTKELEKARDAAGLSLGNKRGGAIGDAIEYMGTLDKKAQKVSAHMRKPLQDLSSFLKGEPERPPTIENRGATTSTMPWKNQWSAVSAADLTSGESGRMMREAQAWMANAANGIGSKFQTVDTTKLTSGTLYEQLAEKLKVAENQAESLRNKIAAIGENANPQALMTLQTKLETAEKKAEKLAMQMAKIEDEAALGSAKSSPAENIRATGDAAEEAAPKVERYQKSVEKTGKSSTFFSKASKFAHGIFDRFGKSFKKHDGFLSQFGRTLKRVVMRMLAMGLIRGVINGIRQGLQMLAKTSSTAAEQFGRFSAMGKAIKVALGSAALSVLNALSGVLFSIAQAAVTAANAVAQFFAVISGSGKYIGVTLAGSFDDLGDSIGGAGGAAKGLLADFDELNIIGQQGGGGGGGGSLGGTTVTEETPQSILAELLNSGLFFEAGQYISDCLGSISEKITAWFEELAQKDYGTKFAQFLNGIFSKPENFESAGSAVANGVNTIVDIIYDFLTNFDAVQAATSLTNGINKFIDTVEWDKIGDTLAESANTIIDCFYGFSETFDAKKAADSLQTAINSFVNTLDFNEAGITVANLVLDALEFIAESVFDIDWYGIIKGLLDFINGILEGLLANPVRPIKILYKFFYGIVNAVGQLVLTLIGELVDTIFGRNNPFFSRAETWSTEWENKVTGWANSAEAKLDELSGKVTDTASHVSEQSNVVADAFDKQREKIDDFAASISNIPSNKNVDINIHTNYTSSGGSGGSNSSGGGGGRPNVNINLMAMASGGIAYGDTLAHIGEYPSARSNPEVVAPLSKLQDILAKSGGGNMKEISELVRETKEQNRLLRVIAQKEIRLSPTPELGQVVTKAQALYGAV